MVMRTNAPCRTRRAGPADEAARRQKARGMKLLWCKLENRAASHHSCWYTASITSVKPPWLSGLLAA
jgi:hypothetical protein